MVHNFNIFLTVFKLYCCIFDMRLEMIFKGSQFYRCAEGGLLHVLFFYIKNLLYICSMKEVYKDIKGYEGFYMVSNFGNIKSLERTYINTRGFNYTIKERILKTQISNGYPSVTLNNKRKKRFCIHRLVAETFIKNPLNKEEVNHKDGNKLNNHISNLEWCTKSQNALHAYNNSLMKGIRKFTDTECDIIRKFYKDNKINYNNLALRFNTSPKTIYNIIKYKKAYKKSPNKRGLKC